MRRKSDDNFVFWLFVFFIIVMLANSGCTLKDQHKITKSTRQKCETDLHRKQLAEFIIKCSEAANPKSDEEGEDLVDQCENTGVRTICPTIEVCMEQHKEAGFMEHWSWGEWGPCR